MDDLIKRLEAATGPSRELDADIFCAVNPGYAVYLAEDGTWECAKPGEYGPLVAPHYSSSIDAALTLVPEKSMWSVCIMEEGPFAQVLRAMPGGGYVGGYIGSYANTPAIALVIAALKAST